MSDRVFVDTNVFVYAVDDDEPAKQRLALELLASVEPVISPQVVGEFYVAASRRLSRPRPEEAVRAAALDLLDLDVVEIDRDLVALALDGRARWQLSYWDALIVRAAEAGGCTRLISEDLAHGQVYGAVTIENPFR